MDSNKPSRTRSRDAPDEKEVLFRTLSQIVNNQHRYRPEDSKADVIRPILEELVRHRIGIPRVVAENLKGAVDDKGVEEILDEAVLAFEGHYWTEENTEAFLDKRRKLHGKSLATKNINQQDNSDNLADLKRIQKSLEKHGETKNWLTVKIVEALVEKGELEKGIGELKKAEKSEFTANPTLIDEIIRKLLESGKLDACVDFYKRQRDQSASIFCTTFMDMLVSLYKAGKTTVMMDLLDEKNPNLINRDSTRNCNILLDVFCQAGDVENINQAFAMLVKGGLIDLADAKGFSKLIEVHLVRHDTAAAVAEFERIYNEYKKMSHKFSLMERLIEDEDLEAMQKILDMSIDMVGEEKSLYDLAHNFLNSGKKSQAKKLLETPGLRYNHEKVKYICDKLANNSDKEGVEDLVMLSRNVFGCDRDYLFSRLVDVHRNNPDKILEIWINIQEEGHAPTDTLKRKIASILQENNREIPFEIPVEFTQVKKASMEKENEKPDVKQKRVNTEKKTRKERTPDPEERNVALNNSIATDDMDGIMKALKGDPQPTKRATLNAVEVLTKAGKFEQACEAAILAKDFKEGGNVFRLLTALRDADRIDLMEQLEDGLGESTLKRLKLHQWKLSTTALHHPDLYLDHVRQSQVEERGWILPTNVAKECFEKNPHVLKGLQGLAMEGSKVAAVVLARYAIDQMDKEGFQKNLNIVKENEKLVDVIIGLNPSLRDNAILEWTQGQLEEINASKDAFKALYSAALIVRRRTPKELGEVANVALKKWITLEDIDARTLKALCKNVPEFHLKEEALKLIKEKESV